MQPVVDVQTSDEPELLFDVDPLAHAHTASVVVVEAVFAYAVPVLHTVADGQEVTTELDDRVVADEANVPIAQSVHTASDVEVAAAA